MIYGHLKGVKLNWFISVMVPGILITNLKKLQNLEYQPLLSLTTGIYVYRQDDLPFKSTCTVFAVS